MIRFRPAASLIVLLLTALLTAPTPVEAKRFGGGASTGRVSKSTSTPVAPRPSQPPPARVTPSPVIPLAGTAGFVAGSVVGSRIGHALATEEETTSLPDPTNPIDLTAVIPMEVNTTTPTGAATPTGGATPTGDALVRYQPFKYNPSHKRDPFRTPIDTAMGEGSANLLDDGAPAQPQREKEPLEAFPLDSLRLVGILNFNGKNMAMIQDPTGKGYTVWVGNHLGDKNGQILRIDPNELELLEDAPTTKNPQATKYTILRLHKEDEE